MDQCDGYPELDRFFINLYRNLMKFIGKLSILIEFGGLYQIDMLYKVVMAPLTEDCAARTLFGSVPPRRRRCLRGVWNAPPKRLQASKLVGGGERSDVVDDSPPSSVERKKHVTQFNLEWEASKFQNGSCSSERAQSRGLSYPLQR